MLREDAPEPAEPDVLDVLEQLPQSPIQRLPLGPPGALGSLDAHVARVVARLVDLLDDLEQLGAALLEIKHVAVGVARARPLERQPHHEGALPGLELGDAEVVVALAERHGDDAPRLGQDVDVVPLDLVQVEREPEARPPRAHGAERRRPLRPVVFGRALFQRKRLSFPPPREVAGKLDRVGCLGRVDGCLDLRRSRREEQTHVLKHAGDLVD